MKILYILLIMLLLAGCGTQKLVSDITSIDSTTTETLRPVGIRVPASMAKATFNPTDLQNMINRSLDAPWKHGEKTKIIYLQDNGAQASLQLLIDSLGNLTIQADCKEDSLIAMVKDRQTVINRQREIIYEQKKSFGEKIETGVGKIIMWLLIIAVLWFIGNFLLKRFTP